MLTPLFGVDFLKVDHFFARFDHRSLRPLFANTRLLTGCVGSSEHRASESLTPAPTRRRRDRPRRSAKSCYACRTHVRASPRRLHQVRPAFRFGSRPTRPCPRAARRPLHVRAHRVVAVPSPAGHRRDAPRPLRTSRWETRTRVETRRAASRRGISPSSSRRRAAPHLPTPPEFSSSDAPRLLTPVTPVAHTPSFSFASSAGTASFSLRAPATAVAAFASSATTRASCPPPPSHP